MSEPTEDQTTPTVHHGDEAEQPPMRHEGHFDLARVEDPTAAIDKAQQLVQHMSAKCSGPDYIANIQGKEYPKVDWWTTVGASLGLFPREEHVRKLKREDEVAYEAKVGVYRGQEQVTSGSAICSSEESTWSGRDEYAIRSMAITRATGKAFRNGLSFLPVMAGMEPTPAEEMPQNGPSGSEQSYDLSGECPFKKHKGETWATVVEEDPGYIKWLLDNVDDMDDGLREMLENALDSGDKELSERGKAQQQFLALVEQHTGDDEDPVELAQWFASWWSDLSADVPEDLREWDADRFREAHEKLSDGLEEKIVAVRKFAFEQDSEDQEGASE